MAFLAENYPLFAGKIANLSDIDVGVFGSSVVGGELADEAFKNDYLGGDIVESGYIMDGTQTPVKELADISRPVSWVLKFQNAT